MALDTRSCNFHYISINCRHLQNMGKIILTSQHLSIPSLKESQYSDIRPQSGTNVHWQYNLKTWWEFPVHHLSTNQIILVSVHEVSRSLIKCSQVSVLQERHKTLLWPSISSLVKIIKMLPSLLLARTNVTSISKCYIVYQGPKRRKYLTCDSTCNFQAVKCTLVRRGLSTIYRVQG